MGTPHLFRSPSSSEKPHTQVPQAQPVRGRAGGRCGSPLALGPPGAEQHPPGLPSAPGTAIQMASLTQALPPRTGAGFPGPSSKPGLSPASGRAGSRLAQRLKAAGVCLRGLLRLPHAPPPPALPPLIHPLSPCWAPGPQPRPTPLPGQQVSEAGTRTPTACIRSQGPGEMLKRACPPARTPPEHPRHLLAPQPLLLPAQPWS